MNFVMQTNCMVKRLQQQLKVVEKVQRNTGIKKSNRSTVELKDISMDGRKQDLKVKGLTFKSKL